MKRIVLIFLIAFNALFAIARSVSLNDGWLFRQTSTEDWKPVNLPHSWNEDAYQVKKYCKGKSFYRRQLDLLPSDSVRKFYLRLEGASKCAEITVNGKSAGHHEGGYTESIHDLTPHLSFTSPNVIEISVDNDRDDIPPISGDFTFFGGIYRDAWLEDYDPLHFALQPFATSGVKVTPYLDMGLGVINVDLTIANEDAIKREATLRLNLYNPEGELIGRSDKNLKINNGSQRNVTHRFDYILNPTLWSPDSPALYRVEAQILDKKGNILDRRIVDTGLRTFGFDPLGRFVLNGSPIKLRGICRHQDMKPLGPALSDEMHRRDMMIAKDMGANFIRISHYPQDRAILEMADKLGLLVWEEIPVIDYVPDDPAYARNAEINLREMITQHYNHPSIVMWGYMNEILLKVPGDNTPEGKATVERTKALINRLESACRALDLTRMTTMAFHGSDRYRTTGISNVPMINGWNLYQGWYGGDLTGFEKFLSNEKRENPSKPIIVSEYGAGSDRRLHSLNPEPFDFSIEYQQKYLEHYLPVIEDSVFIAGATHWNLIDFGSALREESMPRINNKGLLYNDRTPKDVYHYFKAAWRDDIDYVYIASRDWQVRTIVSDSVQVRMPVKIYANTPKVSLLVNGKSMGDSIVKNNTIVYDIPLQRGGNLIIARAGNAIDAFNIDIETVPEHLTPTNIEGVELAVNVGSNCSYTSPLSGMTWVADREYTPGSWGRIGGKRKNVTAEISGTDDIPLYQSMAEEIEGYRFDVPDGDYEIELGFADPAGDHEKIAYMLGNGQESADNISSFSIKLNDDILEESFSPASVNGNKFAIRKKYLTTAKDGAITLTFIPLKGKTILNSIKLRKI